MESLGITSRYFTTLQFLNEKNTTTFAIAFFAFFLITWTFVPFLIAIVGSIISTIIINRVVISKRQPVPQNAAIVITGCSTGIGAQSAASFANEVHVFATFRKEADYTAFIEKFPAAKSNVTPVYVDVTQQQQIESAAQKIEQTLKEQNLSFLGLINSAGYGQTTFMELAEADTMKYQFEVNVFGVISFTNAMLPLIRKFRPKDTKLNPKIINVTSIMARFSGPLAGLYAGSKFALLAVTDAYRAELASQSIDVISVQPGLIKTPFHNTVEARGTKADVVNEAFNKLPSDVQQYYKDAAVKLKEADEAQAASAAPPDVVVDVFRDVLLCPKPAAFYNAGVDANLLTQILPWVSPTTLDLLSSSAFKSLTSYNNQDSAKTD